MSKKIEEEPKSNSYKGALIGALVGIVAAGGLVLLTNRDTPSKKPAVTTSDTKTPATTTANTEAIAKDPGDTIAQDIESTLNSGEEYMGAVVQYGKFFDVSPENEQKLGVDIIYYPLQLDENTVGYITVDQTDGSVKVGQIDVAMGELLTAEGTNFEGQERIGEFGLVVAPSPDNIGYVAMLNDNAGTFVGQAVPPAPQG
jgi:hypothetical protein